MTTGRLQGKVGPAHTLYVVARFALPESWPTAQRAPEGEPPTNCVPPTVSPRYTDRHRYETTIRTALPSIAEQPHVRGHAALAATPSQAEQAGHTPDALLQHGSVRKNVLVDKATSTKVATSPTATLPRTATPPAPGRWTVLDPANGRFEGSLSGLGSYPSRRAVTSERQRRRTVSSTFNQWTGGASGAIGWSPMKQAMSVRKAWSPPSVRLRSR
jgi:hypothetical protein